MDYRGCHIIMTQAYRIELRHGSAGREVHVNGGDIVIFRGVKVIHRYLYAALVRRFADDDDGITALDAGEPGGSVQPVSLDEDLLTGHGLHADGLEIQRGDIHLAPVILHSRIDDDGLAPTAGNTGALGDGHLHHELERRRFMLDSADGGDDNLGWE